MKKVFNSKIIAFCLITLVAAFGYLNFSVESESIERQVVESLNVSLASIVATAYACQEEASACDKENSCTALDLNGCIKCEACSDNSVSCSRYLGCSAG